MRIGSGGEKEGETSAPEQTNKVIHLYGSSTHNVYTKI